MAKPLASGLELHTVICRNTISPPRAQCLISDNLHEELQSGRVRGRTLEHELQKQAVQLERVDHPVLLPFGAWVTEDEIYLSPGRMEAYDAEMYLINRDIIESIIKSAIGLIRGALLK